MPTITSYRAGSFCWNELATGDAAAATKFYSTLFGWTTSAIPLGDGTDYVMLQHDGKDAAALYETKQSPPHWLSYVSVAVVDDAVAKAKELGGTLFAGPMDVTDAGRMAVLADPQGAVFAVWQAGKHRGAEIAREPFTVCWNELGTTDEEAAGAFYSALFGWRMDQQNFGGEPYTLLHNGDEQAGGLYNLGDYGADMPPNWMTYFAVTDTDATCEQARALGGQVFVEPKDIPTIGRMAILADSTGAMFAILQPA